MHFFSPVDKMPLLEIVVGEQTSDAAIAKAFDVARQIEQDPDRGQRQPRASSPAGSSARSWTRPSAMLGEGVPAAVDRAGGAAGRLPDRAAGVVRRGVADAGPADPRGEPARRPRARAGRSPAPLVPGDRRAWSGVRARRPGAPGPASTTTTTASGVGLWPGLAETFGGAASTPRRSTSPTCRSGCSSSRRSTRCAASTRACCAVGARRQHRLDLRDRLPGLDRWGAAVHQRLPAVPRASWPGRASWPRSTATGSSRRRHWSRGRRAASSTCRAQEGPGRGGPAPLRGCGTSVAWLLPACGECCAVVGLRAPEPATVQQSRRVGRNRATVRLPQTVRVP